jgi:hypothetical protein
MRLALAMAFSGGRRGMTHVQVVRECFQSQIPFCSAFLLAFSPDRPMLQVFTIMYPLNAE